MLGFTPVYKIGVIEFTPKNNLQVVAVLNFTPIYKKGSVLRVVRKTVKIDVTSANK